MKPYLSAFIALLTGYMAYAQPKSANAPDCGTPTPTQPYVVSKALMDSIQQKAALPYCVRVVITVFANDNGTSRAATDADVLRQFQNMVNQYQPHNICFILQQIRQVNNTDLNDHDKDTEASEVVPFRVANCLNIFIHNSLPGLNGTAYVVPNYDGYISLVSGAVASTTNLSTMGHEVGHVFGLYHTHEDAFDDERVARSGGCRNCLDAGDLLCDTPADPNQETLPGQDYLADNTSTGCVYSGNSTDDCSTPVAYVPSTRNMMAYGRRACRNQFTADQGTRLRYFIGLSNFAYLRAPETLMVPLLGNTTRSSGSYIDVARDEVTVGQNYTFTVSGGATQQFISNRVVVKPGTRFTPSGGGRTQVTINPYCQ